MELPTPGWALSRLRTPISRFLGAWRRMSRRIVIRRPQTATDVLCRWPVGAGERQTLSNGTGGLGTMQTMKSVWLQAGVLVFALAFTGKADIIYNVSRTIGTGSVSGFIRTDGTIGTLGGADFTDWNLLLTVGANTFDLTGPLSGNDSSVFVSGLDASATANDLLFNFSGPGSGYLLFQ